MLSLDQMQSLPVSAGQMNPRQRDEIACGLLADASRPSAYEPRRDVSQQRRSGRRARVLDCPLRTSAATTQRPSPSERMISRDRQKATFRLCDTQPMAHSERQSVPAMTTGTRGRNLPRCRSGMGSDPTGRRLSGARRSNSSSQNLPSLGCSEQRSPEARLTPSFPRSGFPSNNSRRLQRS